MTGADAALRQQLEIYGYVWHRGYAVYRDSGGTYYASSGGTAWFSGCSPEDVVQQIDTAIEEAG